MTDQRRGGSVREETPAPGYRGSLPPRTDALARPWVLIVLVIFILIFALSFAKVPTTLFPSPTPAPLPSFSAEPSASGSASASAAASESAGASPSASAAASPSPYSSGYGPATWALDPAFAEPAPEATELNILVWERACNGGTLVVGRMAPALVEYQEATVTITMRVRPLGGIQSCPLGPGTPVKILLAEPLGNRTLLDGGREPPSEPSPP